MNTGPVEVEFETGTEVIAGGTTPLSPVEEPAAVLNWIVTPFDPPADVMLTLGV